MEAPADGIDLLLLAPMAGEMAIAKPLLLGRTRAKGIRHAYVGKFGRREAALVRIGIGPEHAAKRTAEAITRWRPREALLFGYAGGLSPELQLGDSFWVSSVCMAGQEPIALPLPESTSIPSGPLQTSRALIPTPDGKCELYATCQAWGVDMEGYAVAAVCRESNVPLQILRGISDTCDQTVPKEFVQFMRADGSVRMEQVAFAVMRNPGLVREILRAMQGSRAASAGLRRALVELRDRYLPSDHAARSVTGS